MAGQRTEADTEGNDPGYPERTETALKTTSFLALFLFYPQRFRIFVETHKEMEKPKRAYVHPLLICPYDPEQEYSKCCAPRRVKCTCALRRKGTGNHYE